MFFRFEIALQLRQLLSLSLDFGQALLDAGSGRDNLLVLLLGLPAQQDSGFGLLPTFLLDLLAAAIPDHAVGFELLGLLLELLLADFKLAKPFFQLGSRCGRLRCERRGGQLRFRAFVLFSGNDLDADHQFRAGETQPVAVSKRRGGNRPAVEKERLGWRQLAKGHALGMARDQTQHGRTIRAGQTKVAAGDAANQKTQIRQIINRGTCRTLTQLQTYHRKEPVARPGSGWGTGGMRRLFSHTGNLRRLVDPSTSASGSPALWGRLDTICRFLGRPSLRIGIWQLHLAACPPTIDIGSLPDHQAVARTVLPLDRGFESLYRVRN